MRQTCIFSGSSHPHLTDAICERLGKVPDNVDLRKFSNGETSVEIKTSVRDQDVFIVQSGSSKINDNVIELLIMIAACKGGSSRSITAVMPYFPYSRQSKRKSHRGAITARMIANLMNVAGVDHVITIDLHATQSQGFFKCPVDNLVAEPLLAKWIKGNVQGWQEAVVVSKNPGGTKRVTSLADALKLSFGIVTTDRRRFNGGNSLSNSAVFGSMGIDGTIDSRRDRDWDEDAEAHIYPAEPSNVTDLRHDNKGSTASSPRGSRSDQSATQWTNSSTRGSPGMSVHIPNRSYGGHTGPSPLGHSATQLPPSASPDREDPFVTSEPHASARGLTRSQTVIGVHEHLYDAEDDGDEYTDERARDVVTGRLKQGHLVDDEQSPAMSTMSSQQWLARKSSDDDPPEHMLTSFMSTASSRPEHGLGGTADATASDEEEEEALQDPELETTITLVGNVRNRPVFIVDDIIDKSGSWIAAAETAVKRGGATQVFCMATHGLFGNDSLREMQECDQIDRIVVTNAFPIPPEKSRGVTKLVTLDVSNLLSEAIRRNHHGESISQLYHHYD